MTARLNLIDKLASNLPIYFLVIIPLSICFVVALTGTVWAATVSVSSEPVKRGSVTPGSSRIVMQRLVLKTDEGSAQWTAVKLNEFGTSDAVSTISSLKIYKETNGLADIQFDEDTLIDKDKETFDAEETTFAFNSGQVITTIPATYYIVYTVSTSTVTSGSPTIGSRLNDETYLTISAPDVIEPFANLQSREITVVARVHGTTTGGNADPNPFSPTTNLCQTCHAVHLAPDFGPDFGLGIGHRTRRILTQPYFESPAVVNSYSSDVFNALCFTCHDGTGSSKNIKSKYNSTEPGIEFAGHKISHESTHTAASSDPGYKPPAAGEKYNAGAKMPCMVCHDVHTSNRNSHAMLADKLYDYAVGAGWEDPNANNRIDSGDESCLVCHKYPGETERTSVIMGINLVLPDTHNPPEVKSTGCLSCHFDVHELDDGN